jgi:hypothetical protein
MPDGMLLARAPPRLERRDHPVLTIDVAITIRSAARA